MTNILIMHEQNYTLKFIFLFLATFAGIFAIWFVLMREESVDWLSSQIIHQVSPYAITDTEDGLIVSNVLLGYGFDLPKGFKTNGAKNLILFKEEADIKKCEIKHFYLNIGKTNGLAENEARLIMPLRQQKLVFELMNESEIKDCGKYLVRIKSSFAVD